MTYEEEQELLSKPEPVWAGSSAADIDAANAAAPMRRSYVEPGQEARGFIAADVGPTGEVISGSYDSTIDDLRNLKAQEAAMRYKGQQLYSSLIQGGATPAEAYRASAHLINFNDPAKAVKLDMLMEKNKPLPLEIETREGRTFYRTGKGGFALVPEKPFRPPPMVKGSIPPDVKQQDSMLEKEIAAKRAELTRGFKYAEDPVDPGKIVRLPFSAREKMTMQAEIADAEARRKALFKTGGHLNPAYNPAVDQTGWEQIKDRWNNPPPPAENITPPAPTPASVAEPAAAAASTEKVKVLAPDGKTVGRIPKSQLSSALKQGYKLAE